MSKWKTGVPQSIQNKNRALLKSHGNIIFVNKISNVSKCKLNKGKVVFTKWIGLD